MTKEATKEGVVHETPQETVDDYLYELPNNIDLELGEGLLENLEVGAEDLLNSANITLQEEEDDVLEQIKQDYGFDETKDAFDEGYVPESVYFFYGKNFAQAVEFLAPNVDNREFAAFLLSDLGRQL